VSKQKRKSKLDKIEQHLERKIQHVQNFDDKILSMVGDLCKQIIEHDKRIERLEDEVNN